MEAEVILKMKNCMLEEEEDTELIFSSANIKEGVDEEERSCYGWIFTKRDINLRGLKDAMMKAWKCEKLRLRKIGGGLVQFFFESIEEACRTVENGPWMFDSYFMAMKKWKAGWEPKEEHFVKPEVWIHIVGLPRVVCTREVGLKFGLSFPKCSLIQIREKYTGGEKYFRIKAEIDLRRKVRRGIRFKCPNLGSLFALFRYEKIPGCCFNCGYFGHNLKECNEERLERKDMMYGDWLIAPYVKSFPVTEMGEEEIMGCRLSMTEEGGGVRQKETSQPEVPEVSTGEEPPETVNTSDKVSLQVPILNSMFEAQREAGKEKGEEGPSQRSAEKLVEENTVSKGPNRFNGPEYVARGKENTGLVKSPKSLRKRPLSILAETEAEHNNIKTRRKNEAVEKEQLDFSTAVVAVQPRRIQ